MVTKNTERVPDWKLERWSLRELPPAELQELDARAKVDQELAARLAALRMSDEELLRTYPPASEARRIVARAGREQPRPRTWRLAWLAAPMLAAAVVLLVMRPEPQKKRRTRSAEPAEASDAVFDVTLAEITRDKGLEPRLRLYIASDGGQKRLAPDRALREGDLLGMRYVAAGRRHGVIFSIDGRGTVTLHWPDRQGGSSALEPSGEQQVDFAYELDDAPHYERFFLVVSHEPIEVDAVLAAARGLAADPVTARTVAFPAPPETTVTDTVLLKVEQP